MKLSDKTTSMKMLEIEFGKMDYWLGMAILSYLFPSFITLFHPKVSN